MPIPGRFNAKQLEFIKKNYQRLSVNEIAQEINKDPKTIEKYILYKFRKTPAEKKGVADQSFEELQLQNELRKTKEWQLIKTEFTKDELNFFEHKFARLMIQFNKDVLNTELSQIFLLIKYDIFMNRNLKERKRIVQDIESLEKMREDVLRKKSNDNDKFQRIAEIDSKLYSLRSVQQANNKEYLLLQSNYADLLKALKASRDQRINDIENRKTSILALLKSLYNDDKFRDSENQELVMFNLAADKEERRLKQLHEYADGKLDYPILDHTTLAPPNGGLGDSPSE